MKTDDRSFILKPSHIPGAGVGVFALHDIEQNIHLDLKPQGKSVGVDYKAEEIPKALLTFCVANENGTWRCPSEFNHMHLVWYLNHSDQPNTEQRDDGYYSTKPIKLGEEILIDYNSLDEPDDKKEDYYRN